jgi:hypothetical protein
VRWTTSKAMVHRFVKEVDRGELVVVREVERTSRWKCVRNVMGNHRGRQKKGAR